jgi:hypothetical protein
VFGERYLDTLTDTEKERITELLVHLTLIPDIRYHYLAARLNAEAISWAYIVYAAEDDGYWAELCGDMFEDVSVDVQYNIRRVANIYRCLEMFAPGSEYFTDQSIRFSLLKGMVHTKMTIYEILAATRGRDEWRNLKSMLIINGVLLGPIYRFRTWVLRFVVFPPPPPEVVVPPRDVQECIVCFDRPVSTRLWPCKHAHLCTVCAHALVFCPLDRTRIERIEETAHNIL